MTANREDGPATVPGGEGARPADNLLGRLALHYKLLTRDQLVESLQEQAREGHRRRIGDLWQEKGWITPQRFAQLLQAQREYEARLAAAAPAVAAPPAEAATGMARLLAFAVERGASDLHVHAGLPVRLRVNGDFRAVEERALSPDQTRRLLHELLTPEQQETLAARGQVDFAYTLPGVGRFRANVYRQQRGTDGVFRVIPAAPPSLSDLGLPLDLARFANYHQGLVLITGPTGSGKSSNLAALVRIVN